MTGKIKIGLFGMYGLYNYGCEAIVRGTYSLLKKAYPDCSVILYTFFPETDKEIVTDLEITVKKVPSKNILKLRRIMNKILRILFIEKQLSLWDAQNVADECDMVFSVGGDIYTIPRNVIDSSKQKRHSSIVEFGEIVLKTKPLIIWGASIGPFGKKEIVSKYYLDHMQKITKIFCREKSTYDYLSENGVTDNISLLPDPAFFVPDVSNSVSKTKPLKIGLNLSPLSVKENFGKDQLGFENEIIRSIISLISIEESEIVLIPHVISPLSESDNDLIYLKKIFQKIPDKFKSKVKIYDLQNGFLGTKDIIRECTIVISARMHCAINAICEGVPTIFITYSQKAKGMSEYIYGNSEWTVNISDIQNLLKEKALSMISKKDTISKEINERMKLIKKEEHIIIEEFKSLIK